MVTLFLEDVLLWVQSNHIYFILRLSLLMSSPAECTLRSGRGSLTTLSLFEEPLSRTALSNL